MWFPRFIHSCGIVPQCAGWSDAQENLPLSFAWSLIDARTNASLMTLQNFQSRASATLLLPALGASSSSSLTSSVGAAMEDIVQVTVRNVWGGAVTTQLPRVAAAAGSAAVNISSPDSVAAASAFGESALAQAARSGSLNDISQV